MSEDRLDRIEKIVESNAKSIQALSDTVAQDRKEWAQDCRRVFEWMTRLAAAQADFYEMQTDHLNHLDRIDDRLTEILDRLTPKTDSEQA